MQAIVNWLEASFGALPLQLLEVWGRLSYFLWLPVAILAFAGFTFRVGNTWGLGRERHAWNAKGFLAIPLTFLLVTVSGYVGSFIVLVPGAQTLESLKDLAVFVCVVLLGYPALITVPFAYGLSDLIEGVPPSFLLDWLPGYFINPTCFWLAYQLFGKDPDFLRARTWARYLAFVVVFMSTEPVLWGYVCSDKFTPEISFRSITPALWFTTSVTWVIAPFAMLGALPIARRLGLFWAEIPGHVQERRLGSKDLAWEARREQRGEDDTAQTQGLPLRMFIVAPFVAMSLVMVGVTAYVSLRTAESDAVRLASRLHGEIAENIALRTDAYLSRTEARARDGASADLSRLLRALPIAGHGRAYLVDRAGTLIASSAAANDPLLASALGKIKRLVINGGLGYGVEFELTLVTKKPLARETWYAHVATYQGRAGDRVDWLIVTAIPEAYYLAGVRTGNSRSALIFAIALLLSLGLAAVLASVVTAPLRRISRATQALARGDLGQRVPASRLEELGSLSLSFNDMAEQLRMSFDNLLREVETRKKRERELEASEARVRASELHLEELVRQRTLALERANRAKSTFLAHMSHEIRTPMNAVLGFGQLMERDSELSPRDRDRLKKILANGYHLLELINNVLEMSKIEAGSLHLHADTFDLHAALANVDAMVRASIEDKGLVFKVEGTSALPRFVRSDAGKIRQILVNLLGNAVKFTRRGEITLRAFVGETNERGTTLRFEVEDTGVGIAADEMDKVFTPFGQTASGIATRTGTGLGITISRDYARLLGGDLRVQSTLGVGTTFEVELLVELGPLGEPSDDVPSPPVVGFEGAGQRPKILIVDDEEDNRTLLRELLVGAGLEVFEAPDGARSVELFAELTPGLVFMDIKMPGMDGVEATRQIRQLPGGAHAPIVILSASVFDDQRAAVLSTGGTEFIAKPFREAEIWSAVERLLGLRLVRRSSEHHVENAAQGPTREEVAALGAATLAALREAVQLGYIQRVPSLLEKHATEHPAAVAGLTKLSRTLEIDKLVSLLEG